MKVGDTVYARYLIGRGMTYPISKGTPLLIREIRKFRGTRRKEWHGWVITPATKRLDPYWLNEEDVVSGLDDLL